MNKYFIYAFVDRVNYLKRHFANPEKVVRRVFKERMGYELNLENPQTYNEKLQWMKLYYHNPLYTTLVDKYAGQVPEDYDILLTLPGVGRKTANVVTSIAFERPAIAVDTHVFRVANRLKLAPGDTPLKVEQGLMKAIPKDKWSAAHHWLIWHGRKLCKARKPLCGACPLNELCPSCEL